jgi:hypothetical protein
MTSKTQTTILPPAPPKQTSITGSEMQRIIEADPALRELVGMHRYRRPARSQTEAEFCKQFIQPLPNVDQDVHGNWIGQIGTNPTVLWSSHTDTVHDKQGSQKMLLAGQFLSLGTQEKDSSCLGADCTVGVWLMRRMYLARIPGLYIWHAEEECGCNGSLGIAKDSPGLLDGIQAAIAFDRKGTTSVITHQWGGRTASDAFAASLAGFLGGDYKADSGGTFTDTANYEHLVPECTNISVGYYDAHSTDEALDLLHARDLLERMLTFDASTLVIERDHKAPKSDPFDWMDDPAWGNPSRNPYGSYDFGKPARAGKHTTLRELVREHPDAVASLLESYGITVDDIHDELMIIRKPQRRR